VLIQTSSQRTDGYNIDGYHIDGYCIDGYYIGGYTTGHQRRRRCYVKVYANMERENGLR
jgi:hypothetical protein